MAVYVDNAMLPYGRMLMSHMVADTHRELVEMADRIGVQRRWLQHAGLAREHFDVAKGHRERALAAGAKPIGWRELAQLLQARKAQGSLEFTPEARLAYFEGCDA